MFLNSVVLQGQQDYCNLVQDIARGMIQRNKRGWWNVILIFMAQVGHVG